MTNKKITSILQFMQSHDRNGAWLEWYTEIENDESTFEPDYVISVLQSWYDYSKDNLYLDAIQKVKE